MATKTKASPRKKPTTSKAKRAAPARGGRGKAPAGKRKSPPRRNAPPAATGRTPRGNRKAAVLAGAVAPAKPVPAERPDPARPTAMAIAQAGLDKKAEDVTVLDVRGLTSYADYFVVMTADSDRQATAIADSIDETLKKAGVTKVGVEGYQGGRWVLVDFGDVVAHVFNRESRGFYDLEGLWADAPRFQVEG